MNIFLEFFSIFFKLFFLFFSILYFNQMGTICLETQKNRVHNFLTIFLFGSMFWPFHLLSERIGNDLTILHTVLIWIQLKELSCLICDSSLSQTWHASLIWIFVDNFICVTQLTLFLCFLSLSNKRNRFWWNPMDFRLKNYDTHTRIQHVTHSYPFGKLTQNVFQMTMTIARKK